MRSLIECSACECLIDSRESACPFCGAAPRQAAAPSWLLGLTLGLGLVTFGCADKDGDTDGTTMEGSTAEVSSTSATTAMSTTADSTTADSTTANSTSTTADSTSTTTTGTTTTTTTDPNPSGNADAVTYGGPDEPQIPQDM